MRAILTATATLAGGWFATIVVGAANAKVMALVLGPAGLGLFAVLQSLARFAATLGGVGLNAGLVRMGTAEIAAGDTRGFEITRRAAWLIAVSAGAIVCMLGLIFAAGIARIVIGDSAQSRAIAVVAFAIPITIASTVQIALINVHQRVSTLAKATSVGSLIGGVIGMLLVLFLGASAIPLVVLSWAVGSWAASRWFQIAPFPRTHIVSGEVAHRVRALLQFGLPYSFSTLAAETVQVAVPILVLRQLGTSGAGLYRAASSISVAYLGFLLVALAQEYYPRLSAASEPQAVARLTMDQQRFLVLVAGPVIFLTMAFAPLILGVLYSSSFAGATGMLTWQLLGDLVRLPSWALAFVLLATGRSRTYFFAETAASLLLLLATWFAIGWLGLPGVGVAYMATYAAYYPLVWLLAARGVPALLNAEARRQVYWTAALICAGIVTLTLPMLAPPALRQPIAVAAQLLIAGICAALAFNALWPGFAQRLRLFLSRQYQ